MKSIFFVISVLWVCSTFAQDINLKVWPAGPPTGNGMTQAEEVLEGNRVRNISEAELFVYLPKQGVNTRAAAIICPGGAYIMESMSHEGSLMAEWLVSQGIAGIVLKYRLPYGHHEVPLDDAQRAIRLVRQKAVEWGIAPSKIGIVGSSAGGHLASTAGTHFDLGNPDSSDPIERISCRPDFMLLIYPVISLTEDFGHIGSRTNLIGTGNKWDLVEKYSNQFHVTPQTPPTFLILADDDVVVPARNSVEFYLALKKNKIPAEMHIYRTGGHGFGITQKNLPVDYWPNLFIDWMKVQGITK